MSVSKRRRRGKPVRGSNPSWWIVAALLIAAVFGLTCSMCGPRQDAPAHSPRHAPSPTRTAHPAPATPDTASPPTTGSPDASGIALSIHAALGVPTDADPSDDYLMDKGTYVLSYNPARRVPNWVSWHLDRAFIGSAHRRDKFLADQTLPAGFVRVAPSDYARSGYDRGHMCPSADRSDSDTDNANTFLMTNMQPQLHELNAGPWGDVEEHERSLARQGKDLFIVAGGVFGPSPKTIGRAAVAIPDASYKILVILEPGQRAGDVTPSTPVLAVIMPNQAGVSQKRWNEYAVSIDEIERVTGYDYLSRVSTAVQQVIEARVARD